MNTVLVFFYSQIHVILTVPTDRQTHKGEIATYWFDEGILVSLSTNIKHTIENITGNIALVKQITGNRTVPY